MGRNEYMFTLFCQFCSEQIKHPGVDCKNEECIVNIRGLEKMERNEDEKTIMSMTREEYFDYLEKEFSKEKAQDIKDEVDFVEKIRIFRSRLTLEYFDPSIGVLLDAIKYAEILADTFSINDFDKDKEKIIRDMIPSLLKELGLRVSMVLHD